MESRATGPSTASNRGQETAPIAVGSGLDQGHSRPRSRAAVYLASLRPINIAVEGEPVRTLLRTGGCTPHPTVSYMPLLRRILRTYMPLLRRILRTRIRSPPSGLAIAPEATLSYISPVPGWRLRPYLSSSPRKSPMILGA